LLGAEAVGIANPVNSYLRVDQLAHILNAAGTRVLVVQGPSDAAVWAKVPELRRTVPTLQTTIVIDGPAEDAVGWSQLLGAARADDLNGTRARPTDIAAYFHTGGTTGIPKLAKHLHSNEVVNAWAISTRTGYADHSALAMGLPMFHVAGVIICSLATLYAGKTIVMLGPQGYRNPSVIAGFWDTVDRYGIDMVMSVPTVLSALTEVPTSPEIASRLTLAMGGAAPVSVAVAERWKMKTGLFPIVGYGLTESTCVSAFTPAKGPIKEGSVGPALDGTEIKVVASEPNGLPGSGSNLPPGETGLVLVRGPNVVPGYNESERDEGVLLEGGWLNTGDLGYLDEDGYLWITGRAKDLIKRGGHGIDPAMVEETLAKHPDVLVAAVVARPDVYAGELPMAFVQLRQGVTSFDPEALKSWCKERIGDPAASPVQIVALDTMPVTTVGKISKVELRRQAARIAVELEIALALGSPIVTWSMELTEDEGGGFSGSVVVEGASERSLELLRRRLEGLPVETRVAITTLTVATPPVI
jgi:fatty-acyl-CoA synthase